MSDPRIETSGSGWGVIRTNTEDMTKAQMLAREKFLRNKALERERRERAKGHTFTKRTYRAARRRLLNELISESEWVGAVASATGVRQDYIESDFWPLYRKVKLVVDRGRREKGLWPT